MDRRAVAERLNELLGPRPCEMCEQARWSVGEAVCSPVFIAVGESPSDIRADLGKYLALVYLECLNCGNTKFFTANTLGVLDHLLGSPADAEDKTADEPEGEAIEGES